MENFEDLSQQILGEVINQSPDSIFIADKAGQIVAVNKKACESLGYNNEELLKLNVKDVDPNFHVENSYSFCTQIKRKKTHLVQSIHIRKDGSSFPVEVNISIIEYNKKEYMLGFARDISKRESKNKLEYISNDYKILLDTTLDGYVVVNMNGELIEVNNIYCDMVGYSKNELLNMSLSDLEVIESKEETKAHIEKIIAKGTDIFETKHRKKNGEVIDVEISVTYVEDTQKKFITFMRDITQRKQLVHHLQESKENLDEAQQLASIGHWELNHIKNSLHWSDEVYRIFGLKPQEFQATYEAFLKYIHPEDVELVNNAYMESVKEKRDYQIIHRVVTESGEIKYVEERCKHQFDDQGEIVSSIGTVHDITQQIKHENDLQIASNVFHYTTEAIVITDKENKIVTINKAYEKLSGYSLDEVVGKNPRKFSSGWGDKAFYKNMWHDIETKGHWKGEVTDRKKSGELYVADITILAVKDSNDNLLNYIGISRDITEFKAQHDKIREIAFYDFLTLLPNRRLFEEEVQSHIGTSSYYDKKFALLFMDLDNFKWINDSLGHNIGDKVLIHVSDLIQQLLPKGAIFSRLGGDEFVIFKPYKDVSKVSTLAQSIINTLQHPIKIDGHEMSVGWSIGISLFPENGKSYEELLKNADISMYKAKELGKNNFQYFNEDMNTQAQKRLEIDNRLRSAIKNNNFTLNYQPKCACPSLDVIGFEALIRWNDSKLGFVPPDLFIPIAEQSGLIYEIGLWVTEQAFKDLKKLHAQKGEYLHMAINVSIKQLEYSSFIKDVKDLLNKYDISPNNIEFEVTETAVMEHIDTILPTLNEIKSLGIKLSIDDFGTGYSSLMYLKKMPIDVLKIDRGFIDEIDQDKDDRAIVEATVLMAKALNLKTVAEGVEKKEHLCILSEIGCDSFQGYYFSKPLPLEKIINEL